MRNILLMVALVATAACGVEMDDRPATAQYIVPAITRPSCGTAACHSSATAREGVVLDTVEGLCDYVLATGGVAGYVTGTAEPRMPLDAPLPDADIALILAFEADQDFPGCR
jgi:hypothetical protein